MITAILLLHLVFLNHTEDQLEVLGYIQGESRELTEEELIAYMENYEYISIEDADVPDDLECDIYIKENSSSVEVLE